MTDDLPTPPLPDAISSTRVLRRRVGERDAAALGVAVGLAGCRRWRPGRRAASARSAARSSSVITVKSRSTVVDAVEAGDARR